MLEEGDLEVGGGHAAHLGGGRVFDALGRGDQGGGGQAVVRVRSAVSLLSQFLNEKWVLKIKRI